MRRKSWPDADFIYAWNRAASVDVVAHTVDAPRAYVIRRASRLRARGHDLKKMSVRPSPRASCAAVAAPSDPSYALEFSAVTHAKVVHLAATWHVRVEDVLIECMLAGLHAYRPATGWPDELTNPSPPYVSPTEPRPYGVF